MDSSGDGRGHRGADLVSWPEDAVVNAPEDVPVCDVESVVWADNCSDALVDCATDTLEQYCPGSYLLGRTYSVTDACGKRYLHGAAKHLGRRCRGASLHELDKCRNLLL